MTTETPRRSTTPLRKALRALGMTLGVLLLVGGLALVPERPLPDVPDTHPTPKAEPFETFLAAKHEMSRAEGVRVGNDERLVRRSATPSRIALMYIHGFTASRAEGEAVMDVIGDEFGANTYYVRLPGHGGGKDAHVMARPEEYFARVEEAFHYTRTLGEKVVVVGTSLGGLLSVWLASRHPDDVAGVIASNPFFKAADPMAFMLSKRVGMFIIEKVYGKQRDASWKDDPEGRRQPGYEDHWLTVHYFRSLSTLDDIRRATATRDVISAVRVPTMLLYYYADEMHQDTAASVPAMLDFFAMTNGGSPHALSRKAAIADGNHILFSTHVRTDKDKILNEMRSFLKSVTPDGTWKGPK